MATVTPYGPFQTRLFRRLKALDIMDLTGLIEELEHATGRSLDRSLASHWAAGRSHLPMDVLPHLAQLIDDYRGHQGAEVVFGPMLRSLGYRVVPEAHSDESEADTPALLHRVVLEALDVVHCITRATDPHGPAGAAMSREEAADARREVDELRRALDAMAAQLDDVLAEPVKPVRLA